MKIYLLSRTTDLRDVKCVQLIAYCTTEASAIELAICDAAERGEPLTDDEVFYFGEYWDTAKYIRHINYVINVATTDLIYRHR